MAEERKEEVSNAATTASQRLEAIKQEELELLAKLNLKKQRLQDEFKAELETSIKKVVAAYRNCTECGATNIWADESVKPLLQELGLSDGTGFIRESEIETEAFLTKYNLKARKAAGNAPTGKRASKAIEGGVKENAEANSTDSLPTEPVAQPVQ